MRSASTVIILAFLGVLQVNSMATSAPQVLKQPRSATTRRTYKVGEIDHYQINVGSDSYGNIDAIIEQEVKKVYPSGDADILETVTKLDSSGAMTLSSPKPRTVTYSPFGLVVGDSPNDPVTLAFFSPIIPEAEDLSEKQFMSFERTLKGMNAKVLGQLSISVFSLDLVGFGIRGTMVNGLGPNSNGQISGTIVWNTKAHRYDRGNYQMSGKDPSTGKPVSINFSFQRIVPKEPAK